MSAWDAVDEMAEIRYQVYCYVHALLRSVPFWVKISCFGPMLGSNYERGWNREGNV